MAEKILQTRLLLKYDTYANWTSNNPVLKAGEMAVATVPAGATTTPTMTNLPNIVLKVGDGSSHYNDLKFVSALAADVHGWAKADKKPTYGYTEIEGLVDYIGGIAQAADTDTQYNLVATDVNNYKYELRSKEKSDTTWTKVADLDLSGLVSRIAALEAKVGNDTVANQIKAKIEALDMGAAVEAGEGEIVYYVNEADGVVEAKTRALVEADIPELSQSKITGLETALQGKETAGAAATALANAKTYTDNQLKAKVESLDFTDEAVDNQFVIAVHEADGVISVERAQPEITNINGLSNRLTTIEGNITGLTNDKQDKLTFDGTYNASTNKAATVSSITSRINALDYDGGEAGDHKFATLVTQADGAVAAEYAQPVIGDIDGLTTRLSGIDTAIAGKQDQLTFVGKDNVNVTPNTTDNRVATEQFVRNAVADLNGAMHFVGKLDEIPTENNAYSAGDVILVGYDEYVFDGTTWQPLGNESIYQTKEDAATQHNTITGLITSLESKHDSEMDALEKKHDDELAALDTKYDGRLKALDYADSDYVENDGRFVTSVTEADGVIAVVRRDLEASDIPELAQSKITGLTTKLTELEQAITNAESGALQDAKDYTDGQIKAKIEALDYTDTAVEKQFVTAVSEKDGVIEVTRRVLAAEDIPVIEQTQVNGLVDALSGKETAGAAATALANAKSYADAQIKAKVESLDYTDAAVAKNVVTAVSEADGVIAVTRAPLADIAWSGEVSDLKQTDTVIVLNCGNSKVGTADEFTM